MRVADRLGDRDAPGREQQVAPAQWPKSRRPAHPGPEAVRPCPGGVQHRCRADLEDAIPPAGRPVADPDAEHLARRTPQQAFHLSVRQEHGPGADCIRRDPEDQASVVRPRVAVPERRAEVRVPDPGGQQLQLTAAQPPVRPTVRQEVVAGQARLHHRLAGRGAARDGHQEAELLDEPGRCPEERLAAPDAFADHADLEVGEVAQPAVDELARPGARAAGEVTLLDQGRPKPGQRRPASDPRPGDPAADDDHVEGAVREAAPTPGRASRRPAGP